MVNVDSDHNPLVPITKKPLVTLSRAPLKEQPTEFELNDDMEVAVHSLVANLPRTEEKLTQLKSATAKDDTVSGAT